MIQTSRFTAGKLIHRCSIVEQRTTTNSQGQAVVAPVTFIERIPCKVDSDGPMQVTRAFAQQQDGHLVHKVSMRWRNDVANGQQFIWHDGTDDRTMEITGRPINPDGARVEMVLICKEPL